MEFRRVKIRATVETATMLLTDEQIHGAVEKLSETLGQLDLAVVSVEPVEPEAVAVGESIHYLD